jgi:hypothetical protein
MVDTVIYAVEGGNLKRYVDQNGGNIGDGVVLATGWSGYKSTFTGVVGEIFAITQEGALWRFVDSGLPSLNAGVIIGWGGWDQFISIFYGGNNFIYGTTSDGQLKRYIVNGDANIGAGVVIGLGSWQNVKVVQ